MWRVMAALTSGLQSLWNPFRDWNHKLIIDLWRFIQLQSLWNPFRDWNWKYFISKKEDPYCFKASETLLGIETHISESVGNQTNLLQSLWNPFRDWNKILRGAFSAGELLQSLWNPFRDWNCKSCAMTLTASTTRFKASETLLGIETR